MAGQQKYNNDGSQTLGSRGKALDLLFEFLTFFDEFHQSSYPMVPQVEAYARKHNLELEEGWKVRVAEDAKQRLLRNPSALPSDSELAKKWVQLFNILSG